MQKIDFHKKSFDFLDEAKKDFLKKASKNNRKFYAKDEKIVQDLLKKDILKIEESLEKKRPKFKNQKLKKSLRKYQIRDKIYFKSNFIRFYFRFIQTNLESIQEGKIDEVMQIIKEDFDNFCSLIYEKLALYFLAKKFSLTKISSFWTKEDEIDIFSNEDKIIVGEVKYKDRKVNKSVYNLLLAKCQKLEIKPDFIIIFSKIGFSKEFSKIKDERLFLFCMNDFYALLPKYLRQKG